jgi:hypothetical protein
MEMSINDVEVYVVHYCNWMTLDIRYLKNMEGILNIPSKLWWTNQRWLARVRNYMVPFHE